MSKLTLEMKKRARDILPILLGAFLLIVTNAAITGLDRGWLSWACAIPALVILALTAAARLYDTDQRGKRWFVRRMGLILTGGASGALILAPLLGYSAAFPSWHSVAVMWGFALSWLTTPNMPPWWKYISGEYKLKKGQSTG